MSTLPELVHSIGKIERELQVFESKYGLLSDEFYQAFSSGELSEFDAYDEYRMEFIEWAALCRIRQKMTLTYAELSRRRPTSVRIRHQLAIA
ncbi:MAG: hypothetical protein GWP17_06995 [Aquificales bacterium]|nr:hypothetical protein [Aquificales bacterium]